MEEQVQSIPDSLRSGDLVSTAYDSIWASSDATMASLSKFDQIMLSDDKIFVVLAVLTIIWIGLILLTWRTDKHLDALERRLGDGINEDDSL
jgi:CcmD family protein